MSKNSVIAVDIDDVLSVYAEALINFSNSRWSTDLTIDDIHEDWATMWKIDHKLLSVRANTLHEELFKELEHQETAKPVLEKLSKEYELVITTSRQRKLLKDTQEWLGKYFRGVFNEVHFAGIYDGEYEKNRHKETKGKLIAQIGADYLIDDQLKHCFAVAELGITGLLFGDYPWNKTRTLPENVSRVRNWGEVEEYFAGK